MKQRRKVATGQQEIGIGLLKFVAQCTVHVYKYIQQQQQLELSQVAAEPSLPGQAVRTVRANGSGHPLHSKFHCRATLLQLRLAGTPCCTSFSTAFGLCGGQSGGGGAGGWPKNTTEKKSWVSSNMFLLLYDSNPSIATLLLCRTHKLVTVPVRFTVMASTVQKFRRGFIIYLFLFLSTFQALFLSDVVAWKQIWKRSGISRNLWRSLSLGPSGRTIEPGLDSQIQILDLECSKDIPFRDQQCQASPKAAMARVPPDLPVEY